MRIYVDSSALLKRVFAEPESEALVAFLREHAQAGDALTSSSLAWIEVSRAIRAYASGDPNRPGESLVEVATSGLLEKPISSEVVALARRTGPSALRSLDAIHLASAILLDIDLVIGYDRRLIEAAEAVGFRAHSPGRPVS